MLDVEVDLDAEHKVRGIMAIGCLPLSAVILPSFTALASYQEWDSSQSRFLLKLGAFAGGVGEHSKASVALGFCSRQRS